MASALGQLRKTSIVVADTGDNTTLRPLESVGCTTDPTLVLRAMSEPSARIIVECWIAEGAGQGASRRIPSKDSRFRMWPRPAREHPFAGGGFLANRLGVK